MTRLLPRNWTVRLRLTVLYAALFLVAGGLLLGLTYLLVRHNLDHSPWADGGNLVRVDTDAGTVLSPAGDAAQAPARIQAQLQHAEAEYGQREQAYQDAVLRSILTRGGIALGVVGVLAFGLGWLIAGRALRPLHRVTATAQRIASTKAANRGLHERISLAGPADEIKKLADAFDTMLQRLDRSFEGQRRFIANAAHELRTPLVINRSLIETAMARTGAPPATRQLGQALLTSGARQERLIDGLLALARSDTELTAHIPVDLADIVEYVVDLAEPAAQTAAVTLTCDLKPALTAGDPILLEQLAANLVHNAIRHNRPDNGWVHVATDLSPDGQISLTVTNSGPSVPADAIERLFEPFSRLARDRTDTSGGVGLGLSIVEAVTRAHHGTIHAQPGEDGGLLVRIRVPAHTR